jgi:PAS domain-containing protein
MAARHNQQNHAPGRGRIQTRVQAMSIRGITVTICLMIGTVATILSLVAGSYFRQSALEAQVGSLSRVIEVASQEMLKSVRGYTFDLGMHLAHSEELILAMYSLDRPAGRDRLVRLLDDPFINGFVGFANINLEQIRVYDLDLNLVAESTMGSPRLEKKLTASLAQSLAQRKGVDRLKATDVLWISPQGPLHSTLVPIAGLRQSGYLEIIINPVFNLPDIGSITRTPISIFTPDGKPVLADEGRRDDSLLEIDYVMPASDGQPAFKIVGYEDVGRLNQQMDRTMAVTVGGFLVLTFGTLLFALWLFNRFLFIPVNHLVQDMREMAAGKFNPVVSKDGLRDISMLAEAFNAMARQVRLRTNDLERLLSLDDSAILCFGSDQEAVYFNLGAASLFGFAPDEVSDVDMSDVFADDIARLVHDAGPLNADGRVSIQARLACLRRDGSRFERNALIRSLDIQGGHGYAIVLYALPRTDELLSAEAVVSSVKRNEQRMNAVEESLNNLLEIARNAPTFTLASTDAGQAAPGRTEAGGERPAVREQAVNVMLCALACWEHDLDKSKLDLAEESRIWPVYIDKSTPTTRTLDKYLNTDTCPKNPRTQRVIDTAEFVLKQLGRKSSEDRKRLQQALNDFRMLISGVKPAPTD